MKNKKKKRRIKENGSNNRALINMCVEGAIIALNKLKGQNNDTFQYTNHTNTKSTRAQRAT